MTALSRLIERNIGYPPKDSYGHKTFKEALVTLVLYRKRNVKSKIETDIGKGTLVVISLIDQSDNRGNKYVKSQRLHSFRSVEYNHRFEAMLEQAMDKARKYYMPTEDNGGDPNEALGND